MLGMATAALSLQSCNDDDDNLYYIYPASSYNALVTVKPNTDNTSVFLQLDDSTTLFPRNIAKSPFGTKEVRALAQIIKTTDQTDGYTYTVDVNHIDSILTKNMAANLGDEKNATTYGTAPVEIVNDWVTVAEDGYLTLRFRTNWGGSKKHWVNLVQTDPSKPYDLTFFHSAEGDGNAYTADGLVAFRLDQLPVTDDKNIEITLHWKSFSGDKSHTFKLAQRKAKAASLNLSGLNYKAIAR